MSEQDEISTKSKKMKFVAYALSAIGTALYLYGYFSEGHPSLVNWPDWAAEYIPNIEAEIGIVISFIALIPLYRADA